MASELPPPPTTAPNGSFAWTAWYNQLYQLLSSGGTVAWDTINKAGSSIADLANHTHAVLGGILGSGQYHISATEQARVTATVAINTKSGSPTTSDIPNGDWAIYKDSSAGTLRLWANDGGTMKSVTLT